MATSSYPDPATRVVVEDLKRSLGRVQQLLPALFPDKDDPRQVAALSEILSRLAQLDASLNAHAPRGGVNGGLVNGDRLGLLQQVAFFQFEQSVDALQRPLSV